MRETRVLVPTSRDMDTGTGVGYVGLPITVSSMGARVPNMARGEPSTSVQPAKAVFRGSRQLPKTQA